MEKHILALLASILAVVFLSGCIGQTPSVPGVATGVIIKSFAPDMPEVFSDDPVTFMLNVENVGGEDAYNVQAKLFGLGTDWTGDDWINTAQRTQTVPGILERSQPDLNIPGGSGDLQWDLKAPDGLKVDNTYTAGVRLYYDYKTTALAHVKVYSNDYLRSNPTQAETIMKSSGIDTFTVTSAPITIELAGLARPLIVKGSNQQASITILVKNIGQGSPWLNSESDMTVTVTKIYINNEDKLTACMGSDKTARLPRSGSKSISCTFTVPSVDSYTTIPVEIELSYKYFLDGSASIKVLKAITTGGAGVSQLSSSTSSTTVTPGTCIGSLSATVTGQGTCRVDATVVATNCDGQSWKVKDTSSGAVVCGGDPDDKVNGNSFTWPCVWPVSSGSYTYSLYINNVGRAAAVITCLNIAEVP